MEQIFVWKHKSHWLFKAFLHTYFYIIFSSCFLALTLFLLYLLLGFPGGASGKEPACQGRRLKRSWFDPWVRKIPWRRTQQPTPAFLPGKSYGQRSPESYSPQARKELDKTEATECACMYSLLTGFVRLNQMAAKDFPWRFIHEQRNKISNWIGIVYRLIN